MSSTSIQLPSSGGSGTDLDYKGTWNANTNTPTLLSGVGNEGDYYVVSVSGSTNLDGITTWIAGDWAVFNGIAWERVVAPAEVNSVFGRTGVVTATSNDYTWAQIDKTTSSIADITTKNHSDLVAGTGADHSYIDQDVTSGSSPAFTSAALTTPVLTTSVSGTAVLDEDDMASDSNNQLATQQSIKAYVDTKATNPLNAILSNSLLSGGLLSINADTTKFDVSAGSGFIIDSHTDPTSPTKTNVSWGTATAQAVTNIATHPVTYVWINSSGNIVQTTTDPLTYTQRRDYILLGALAHPDNTNISAVNTTVGHPTINISASLVDFQTAIGPINSSGNAYSANGANLNLNKSAGTLFFFGINWFNDKKNPNEASISSGTALTFLYTWKDGAGGWNYASTNAINPGRYDDGTGGALQPNGTVSNNSWSVHRVYLTAFGDTYIQYSQSTYSTIASALDGIRTSSFDINPALQDLSFRCYIIARGGGADLSDSGDATFINAGILGENVLCGSSAAVTSLQQAYDNSTTPEITLSSTNGALSVIDASAPIGAPLFEIQNNAQTTSYMSVTSSKTSLVGDLEQAATDSHYFGDSATNGTWRIVRSGDELEFQKRESGTYNTKGSTADIPVQIVYIKDVKASGTSGGTGGADAVNTRVLNTLEGDTSLVTSLASNQFTLPAGKYRIHAACPAYKVDLHKAFLYNVSDTSYDIDGQNGRCATGDAVISYSFVNGEIEIASSKTYEIRHWTKVSSGANDFGFSTNSVGNPDTSELYTVVEIIKIG